MKQIEKIYGLKSVNDGIPLTIPIDVRAARIFAGSGRLAGCWTSRNDCGSVGYDIVVFEMGGMTVAKSDVAALIVPGGEASCVAMWGGKKSPIRVSAMIGEFVGTVAAIRKKYEGRRMDHHACFESGDDGVDILVGQ